MALSRGIYFELLLTGFFPYDKISVSSNCVGVYENENNGIGGKLFGDDIDPP